MKKRKEIFIIAFLIALLLPFSCIKADTGTVTAESLNMRSKASTDGSVIRVLREGTNVTIQSVTGGWYKIKYGGETGYVSKKYITVKKNASTGKEEKKETDKKSSDGTCERGDQGDKVKTVQNKLKKLGYYSKSVDGDYGSGTEEAVKAFQKNNGLKVTGKVNSTTLNKLCSSDAKKAGESDKKENDTCSPGDTGDTVKKLQKKLKNLGYYSKAIDGDYGKGTQEAVKAFQKNNGLKVTGKANSSTVSKLYDSNAKKARSSGENKSDDDTCSPGDKGDAVKKLQKKLKKLGYYNMSIDGDYGNGTKTAVKAFQKKNGLNINGIANSKTIAKLNSSNAKKADSSSSESGKTEELIWFKNGSDKIPKGSVFKVKDIKTGKVFTCKRWSGVNHCDSEPLTADDTAVMKSIYGHWSWKRRSILVKYDGHVYAASMNGMPHGTGAIEKNKFDGHFCIHFTGSKTHGSKKVDETHQKCVKTALNYSW